MKIIKEIGPFNTNAAFLNSTLHMILWNFWQLSRAFCYVFYRCYRQFMLKFHSLIQSWPVIIIDSVSVLFYNSLSTFSFSPAEFLQLKVQFEQIFQVCLCVWYFQSHALRQNLRYWWLRRFDPSFGLALSFSYALDSSKAIIVDWEEFLKRLLS